MPTLARVRADTLQRLAVTFARRPAVASQALLTVQEAFAPGALPEPREERALVLTLPQLAHVVGAPLVASGTLASIALVAIDPTVGAYAVRRLDRAEATVALRSVRFGIDTEPRPATVFERWQGRPDAPPVEAELLDELAGTVRCVELRVGPALLEDTTAAKSLVGELLDG
jgi:hypothetical protein